MAWFETLARLRRSSRRRIAWRRPRPPTSPGLPPPTSVTAGFDPLEDEGRDYARALAAAGVPAEDVNYPALVHDFFIMADVSPAVVEAAKEAGAAVRAALG